MTSEIDTASLLTQVEKTIRDTRARPTKDRPCVTLAYAQSLDGSIATAPDTTTLIGGPRTRVVAHQLRALHDAVLIGVNTLLVDDPLLNVRHVAGANPRPIVVDSHLRTPLTARLLCGTCPCIATTHAATRENAARLEAAGAEILRVTANAQGGVDLAELFKRLPERGISSVMVEGGARITTSVLRGGLADQIVLTISPELMGGLRAVGPLHEAAESRPRLENRRWCILGDDLIVLGEVTCARRKQRRATSRTPEGAR